MAKPKTRNTMQATRGSRAAARKPEPAPDAKPLTSNTIIWGDRAGEQEKPLSAEEQLVTPAEERLRDSDQGMRMDGTTPRHTEPLGPPAPGQQGRPGPERRVTPMNGVQAPSSSLDPTKARDGSDLGATIRVTATRVGYIDHVRRRVGDVFDVKEKQFTDSWMEAVDAYTPTKVTSAPQALKRAHDETLAERAGQKAAPKRSTGDADTI